MKKISLLIILMISTFGTLFSQKSKRKSASKDQYPQTIYITTIGSRSDFEKKVIPKSQLLVQLGIDCDGILRGGQSPCKVDKYSMLLIHDQKVIFSETVTGPLFTKRMKDEFKNLSKEDILVIYGISIQRPTDTQKVPSFVYEIE